MLPCLHAAAKGGLVINELMQSNVDCLMVDHDFPDSWVELYNTSDQTLQISNYRLGATNVFAKAGRLSPTEKIYIGAGEHMVVCLDKTSDKPLHIAFNLETSHGVLYLFDSAGQVLDSVAYGKMPAPNVALGRVADGSAAWQHELTPTPGQANRGGGSEELLPPPVFSVAGHLAQGLIHVGFRSLRIVRYTGIVDHGVGSTRKGRFRCVFDKNAIVLLKFRLFQLINNLFVNSMPKFSALAILIVAVSSPLLLLILLSQKCPQQRSL
jgi:hypothetical protein